MNWKFLIPFILLLTACASPGIFEEEFKPQVIVDQGSILHAGTRQHWEGLSAGQYDISVSSSDGVKIAMYPSIKDLQLAQEGSEYAEVYQNCHATESTRFNRICTVMDGAVFSIQNPNWVYETNVDVKITKIS